MKLYVSRLSGDYCGGLAVIAAHSAIDACAMLAMESEFTAVDGFPYPTDEYGVSIHPKDGYTLSSSRKWSYPALMVTPTEPGIVAMDDYAE